MAALFDLSAVTVARAGRTVLDGLSLDVRAGERIAILGDNGAGKTTLLRTLVGLEWIAAGTLTAFGRERRIEKDFAEVRRRTGFLFQDPDDQLFSPTVVEDVAFGPVNLGLPRPAALERARATLGRLGLTVLAERVVHHLSGGEKRLVALAGLLAMEPEALLLDEPTNGLDGANRERLLAILKGLPVTLLMASHDGDAVDRLASRRLRLAQGRLHAD